MKFIIDNHTLEDLNLLGKFKPNSIFSIFNRVKTAGGERLLEKYFKEPLTDPAAINSRSGMFQYFAEKQLRFSFEGIEEMLQYMALPGASSLPLAIAGMVKNKLLKSLVHDDRYDKADQGLRATISCLNAVKSFLPLLSGYPQPEQLQEVQQLLQQDRLKWLQDVLPSKLPARCHYLMHHVFRHEIENLISLLYYWDVMMAVAGVARDRGFFFARALPAEAHAFKSSGISHPALSNATANPIAVDSRQHLLFLTGANMAGKSTLMKSFGIAVYLAHLGFPVAARELEFSVMEGLYTSINLPDNLAQGYSHFYAEVLRVKKVAEDVSKGHHLVVIFDELFKGTNVKDAYDATLEVTKAFGEYENSFFMISTHILEVADALVESNTPATFLYLPTIMNGAVPEYTYRLTPGVTNDRQGMAIIENEGILEMLELK
ncbi:DNA mismatch repair protein [Chitinophaga sp.]|uniref:MutS-related protein n=1 Tax=Chitinophaga sp. TaxID=1869181 RepID=UPI0031D79C1D